MNSTKTPGPAIRLLSLLAMLGAAMLPCLAAEQATFTPLNGVQIRSVLQGKGVSDDRHWAHRYLPVGRLVRLQNGGKWMAQRDELCFVLPEVSSTAPVCFQVVRHGSELQYLDGERVAYQVFVRSGAVARNFEGTTER